MSIFSNLVKWWNNKPFFRLGNYFLFNNQPTWIDLKGTESIFHAFYRNPVLYSVIMILANESANMRWTIENKSTGEVEPESTNNKEAKKIYSLLNFPNPLQSRWEFLQQNIVFHKLAGNSFVFANVPNGFKVNIQTIQTLQNVWPQYMKAKTTGKYFSATTKEDIIEKWVFDPDAANIEMAVSQVLHRNNPTINSKDVIFGQSTASSLFMPLSNIEMAYESRNVMMKNRGMRAIISSALSDMAGKVAILDDSKEAKSIDEAIKKYGTLEGQKQFFFSKVPLDVKTIDQDVRKLGLFEEIESSAIEVCHAYGVPEILLKKSLEGTTYENQESAIRRLYQGTIIPQMNDFCIALNRFLGLEDSNWVIKGSFDHIPALQKSEKEKAEAYKTTSEYMKDLFLVGGVTLNVWLDMLELPKQPNGDRTIFEMDESERNVMLSMMGKSVKDPVKSLNGHLKELVN